MNNNLLSEFCKWSKTTNVYLYSVCLSKNYIYIYAYISRQPLCKKGKSSEFQSSMTLGFKMLRLSSVQRKKCISKTSWPADWLVLNPQLVAHLLVIFSRESGVSRLLRDCSSRYAQPSGSKIRNVEIPGKKTCLNYACRGQPLYDTMMYI